MIITRKVQIVIHAKDDDKKAYIHQIYEWRNHIRKAANLIVSHKFVQQNIRDFTYVDDEFLSRFLKLNPDAVDKNGNAVLYVKDILKKEPGNSEMNSTYRIISSYLKGKCPSDFMACLNQAVVKTYKERIVDFLVGKASIPSYKNIPIPFPGKILNNITELKKEIRNKKTGETRTINVHALNFYHIPIELYYGKDRSNNRVIVKRALSGEYKFCGSSLWIDDDKKKIYLLISVDIPQKKVKLNPDKTMYAVLDIEHPIMCSTDITITENPALAKGVKWIGNKEEYLYRRLQIQAALRRLQIAMKYNTGGHGRKNKLTAIDRFHDREKNYIDTKAHLYSKLLVEEAVANKCSTIVLANYADAKEKTEGDGDEQKFLLRNWGYHGLSQKIEYKAKKYGVKMLEEMQNSEKNENQ